MKNTTEEEFNYYDNILLTEKITKIWNDSCWINNIKELYYYGFLGEDETVTNNPEITIFPNPNNGRFQIEFIGIEQCFSISVFDLKGEMVFNKKNICSGPYIVNLSNMPKGLYIVKILNPNTVFTEKIIVN